MCFDHVYCEYMYCLFHDNHMYCLFHDVTQEEGAPAPKAKAKQPSGALSNPNPDIPDLTPAQYMATKDKSVFGRPAAAQPLQEESSAYGTSSVDEGEFFQDRDLTKGLPILSVHSCMLMC